MKPTVKGYRTLLTGETVPEYNEELVLKQIETRCPDKWVFVDLETGNTYRWDVDLKTWRSPPVLAKQTLRAAMKKMISFRGTVPGVSE